MEKKKLFVEPEVEVVRFDEKDVITTSYTSTASYAIDSIRNFFNINVT